MDENSSSETRCKTPSCGRLLTQAGGGHRKREYCDDTCRQAARRHRVKQAHRDEVNRRWATFTAETRGFLDWLCTRYGDGKDQADAVELAIHRETDRSSAESSAQFELALATLREKQLSRVEKLKARILQLEQERKSSSLARSFRRSRRANVPGCMATSMRARTSQARSGFSSECSRLARSNRMRFEKSSTRNAALKLLVSGSASPSWSRSLHKRYRDLTMCSSAFNSMFV
jgi:hypothetical protein